jgi:hypothetical protein
MLASNMIGSTGSIGPAGGGAPYEPPAERRLPAGDEQHGQQRGGQHARAQRRPREEREEREDGGADRRQVEEADEDQRAEWQRQRAPDGGEMVRQGERRDRDRPQQPRRRQRAGIARAPEGDEHRDASVASCTSRVCGERRALARQAVAPRDAAERDRRRDLRPVPRERQVQRPVRLEVGAGGNQVQARGDRPAVDPFDDVAGPEAGRPGRRPSATAATTIRSPSDSSSIPGGWIRKRSQ